MQTFLPYPDFSQSASCLDRSRLGKQRSEALGLLRTLLGQTPGKGWQHHPAARMWKGYEVCLSRYALVICNEWSGRGYLDSVAHQVMSVMSDSMWASVHDVPPWLGDEAFHLSHQSNLVRKNPEHYRPFFPDVPDDLPYVWPVSRVG